MENLDILNVLKLVKLCSGSVSDDDEDSDVEFVEPVMTDNINEEEEMSSDGDDEGRSEGQEGGEDEDVSGRERERYSHQGSPHTRESKLHISGGVFVTGMTGTQCLSMSSCQGSGSPRGTAGESRRW